MNRKEFIEKFRIALAGEVNNNIITENVNYYEDYIDMELQKGKSEGQIFAELGDPRLLAKTIIETNKIAGSNVREEEYTQGAADGAPNRKAVRMPGWVLGIIVVLIIGIIIATVTSVISFLLPVFIPILCIVLIVRFIQSVLR